MTKDNVIELPVPSLDDSLEKLAQKIAADSLGLDVHLADRLDALKALTTYKVAMGKAKPKDDDQPPADTILGFKRAIEGA